MWGFACRGAAPLAAFLRVGLGRLWLKWDGCPVERDVMAVGLPCLLWAGKGLCLVQLAWHLQEHPKVHLGAICPQIWGVSCQLQLCPLCSSGGTFSEC